MSRTIFARYLPHQERETKTAVDSLPGKIGTVTGASKGALQEAAEAIRSAPNDPARYLHRAQLYDSHEEFAKAVADYTQVIKLDRYDGSGVQYFWDKAWAAYAGGDLNGAKTLLRFIGDTYNSPNIRRQADYWYARILDREGDKADAAATYQRLASAPYEDVYAIYSESHGGKHVVPAANPTAANREDWREIAERSMPAELRLAYELTALQDFHDAAAELAKNARQENQQFADALAA